MRIASRLLPAIAALAIATGAFAQYKYVGADGRVTYSDQPPPAGTRVVEEKRLGRTPTTAPVTLPFAVQQAMSRFPVTLYTGDACAPCDDGRAYLRNRGVPFTEKTVSSNEDIVAFRQTSADGTAPVLLVGSRKATGYTQSSWAGLLDDAGYPQTSALPPNYQNPPATALSPNTRTPATNVAQGGANGAAAPARTTRGAAPAAAPAPPSSPDGNAPPGFRF